MPDKIVKSSPQKEAHTRLDCRDKHRDEDGGGGNVQYCRSQRNAQMRIWFCHLVSFWLRVSPLCDPAAASGYPGCWECPPQGGGRPFVQKSTFGENSRTFCLPQKKSMYWH